MLNTVDRAAGVVGFLRRKDLGAIVRLQLGAIEKVERRRFAKDERAYELGASRRQEQGDHRPVTGPDEMGRSELELLDQRGEVVAVVRCPIRGRAIGAGVRPMVAPAVRDQTVVRGEWSGLVAPGAHVVDAAVDQDNWSARPGVGIGKMV